MTPCSRRSVLAAGLAGLATVAAASPASASASASVTLPEGYADVDPRTARRVPLTLSLRDGVPLYPGDPAFRWHVATDTRTPMRPHGDWIAVNSNRPHSSGFETGFTGFTVG